VELGQAVIEFEMKKHHANTMGTLHGGVICTIADTAMGVVFATMLEEGESLTTLELKINYLKPVWKGTLLALGKVVKKGRMIGLVECDIVDENDYSLPVPAVLTWQSPVSRRKTGLSRPDS